MPKQRGCTRNRAGRGRRAGRANQAGHKWLFFFSKKNLGGELGQQQQSPSSPPCHCCVDKIVHIEAGSPLPLWQGLYRPDKFEARSQHASPPTDSAPPRVGATSTQEMAYCPGFPSLSLSLSLSQLFPTTAPALFSLPSPPSTCRTPSTTLSATERAPNLCTHINQPLATAFIAARAFALLFSRKFPASTVASREESKSEAASISTSCTTLLLAASAPCLLSSHTPSAGRLWTLPCASEAHSGGANASGWKRGLPP